MRKKQLKVIKADGTVEDYLHTKVMGTIHNALCAASEPDITIADDLTEVATYFLYETQHRGTVTSGEIFSIIKALLARTHASAAIALDEHHYQRKLNRSRIEVICAEICELKDASLVHHADMVYNRTRWNKSIIAADLVDKYDIAPRTARAIASMVEDKILNIGLTLVSSSLIKQIVLSDTAIIINAEQQLQTA